MKKLLLSLILLLTVLNFSLSQDNFDWIELHGFIEGGYLLEGYDIISKLNKINMREQIANYVYSDTFYLTLNTYIQLFDIFQVGGEIRSIFKFVDTTNASSVMNKYTFFLKIVLDNIEIGFKTFCEHDTSVYQQFKDNNLFDRRERNVYIKFVF